MSDYDDILRQYARNRGTEHFGVLREVVGDDFDPDSAETYLSLPGAYANLTRAGMRRDRIVVQCHAGISFMDYRLSTALGDDLREAIVAEKGKLEQRLEELSPRTPPAQSGRKLEDVAKKDCHKASHGF